MLVVIRTVILYSIILLILLFTFGYSLVEDKIKAYKTNNIENQIELSLWVVDWTYKSSIEEAIKSSNGLQNIQLFTTYFDHHGNLYQTEESTKLIEAAFQNKLLQEKNLYLTIINDQFTTDNKVIQKNPQLLHEILKSKTTRQNHIKQIIDLATQYPFDGVEIDYEKIPKELYETYNIFLDEINTVLQEHQLSLRVVLEPGFPFEKVDLPTDIKYVVMAYNLFGFHSEPGPKADYPFLEKLTKKLSKTDLDINFALATGGFSWKNGKVTQLTEQNIEKIILEKNIIPTRDSNSDALTFTYFDGENNLVEIWYADEKTLSSWIEYLVSQEYYEFSLWRSGGLSKDTMALINKY